MTFPDLITRLRDGADLDAAAVESAAALLLDTAAGDAEKADFLKALATKGERPAEIAAFVRTFLSRAVPVPFDARAVRRPCMDICGTGGDKLGLFNISTASMFLLAAAGACVVKHGNRGITSKSGGADVLEALGIRIDLSPEQFAACVMQHGAGFMLAPHYHPAFKAVAGARAALAKEGVRTIFNLIGPLLNPVQPPMQLVGVFDPALPPVYAEILRQLGRSRAWAVHGSVPGAGGMDEVSTLGPTRIVSLVDGVITDGMETVPLPPPASVNELTGGGAAENARLIEGLLTGETAGAKRDIVLANTAASLRMSGMAATWDEGLRTAQAQITSGAALAVLRALQGFGK